MKGPRPPSVLIVVRERVFVRGLPPRAEYQIRSATTFDNPEFSRRDRLGLWLGQTPRSIKLWRRLKTEHGEVIVVPRGAIRVVEDACRREGLAYQLKDVTVCPPLEGVTLHTPRLYPYQSHALNDLLSRRQGLLVAPVGSGKTNIALSVIPRVNTPTLIMTHTKELLNQTRARCRSWLGIEAGQIGGGVWDVRPVTVAMLQTLAKRGCDEIADMFGCVMVDEVHHAPAKTWSEVLNQLPARYRYGFTATAWRKDGLGRLMYLTIGDVLAKVDPAEVVEAGRVVVPEVEVVHTSFYFDLEDPTDWTAMLSAMVGDPVRNALIESVAREHVAGGARLLVLTARVEHAYALGRMLAELEPVVLVGEMGQAERKAGMRAVRAGAALTIATTSLLGEGVDVPAWDTLVLATPIAGGPRTIQAAGRVSRAAPGKDRALIIDVVDVAVPALVAAHRKRTELFDQMAREGAA